MTLKELHKSLFKGDKSKRDTMIQLHADTLVERLFDCYEKDIRDGYAYLSSEGKLLSEQKHDDDILLMRLSRSYFDRIDNDLWVEIVEKMMGERTLNINEYEYEPANDNDDSVIEYEQFSYEDYFDKEWLADNKIDIYDIMKEYLAIQIEDGNIK